LAKVFSDYNIKQLHIAETEKYAHVTFFLNGGMEEPFAGEERILVPSPAVASYDQKPEMSAKEVTDHLLDAIKSEKFGFVVVNYANPDMVGHTGNLQATIKAVETVDECLAKVVPAVLEKKGAVFIVGDHGNAEEMFNLATGDVDKEHNMYPVPFIVAAERFANQGLQAENGDLSLIQPAGILSDVAPTIIALAGLPEVSEMTGTCVVR
jgi:2,3-bisphosphoglycerate-independent phosphoglycerate mutase